MPFPLVNKIIFVKYQGYPSKHIYTVLASGVIRVLSGNQRKAILGNNAVKVIVLVYLKICY